MAGALHALAWAKSVRQGVNGEVLTPSQKLALMVLADYSNAERGGIAWPSIETLAADCLVGVRQMHNVLSALERAGLLQINRKVTPWGGNTYRLLVGAIPAPDEDRELPAAEPEPAKLNATDICTALIDELLPVYLGEATSPAAGYLEVLDAADDLAADHPGLSKDLPGYLRDAVLTHAAEFVHDIEPRQAARLSKEAKVLGTSGHRWLISALFHTASAGIDGDPISYTIAAARRLMAERTQGVAA